MTRGREIVALVNIGASVMNINILKGGTFAFTRDISIGGNRYNETIQREFNVSYEQAEKAKRNEAVEGIDHQALSSIINNLNTEISSEVIRSFDYFKTTSTNENIDRIVLSGGASKIPDLLSQLAESQESPLKWRTPLKKWIFPKSI